MSETLTISITETLKANQALGPDTVEILKGGIWLTADEADKVRLALSFGQHRDTLALLTPAGKEEA